MTTDKDDQKMGVIINAEGRATGDLMPLGTSILASRINAGNIVVSDANLFPTLDGSPALFAPCAHPPYFAGPDEDGDDQDESWDQETGRPGIGIFANALQVWSLLQEDGTTVVEAARVFRVPEAMIHEAVEWHPWMLIETNDGVDCIGHDGE